MILQNDDGTIKRLDEGGAGNNASLGQGYAVCDTAESTIAKTATIDGYLLKDGGIVAIKFTNAVPTNSTLNINSKGAKPIYYNGDAIEGSKINAGETATLMYNGTNYEVLSVTKATTALNVVFTATEAVGETLTATKGQKTKTAIVQTGFPNPTAILYLDETGEWDINGRKITVGSIGEIMTITEDIYGYDWTLAESNPESTIAYPSTVTNANYGHIGERGTPVEIQLGDWAVFRDEFLECRPVMLNPDGTVAYELNHNDQTKKLDGTDSRISDTTHSMNAMVEFPKRYIKRYTDSNNIAHFRISRMKLNLNYKCLAWMYGATEQTAEELDAIYLPMYPGSSVNSKVRSLATGGKPMNTNPGATEWTQIQANGTGWIFDDWSDKSLITDLMFMMGKSTDVQKHHGYGNNTGGTSASSLLNIGGTKTYGSNYGGTGNSYMKFLWLENYYGDSWKRTMGMYYLSNVLYVKDFPPYTVDNTVTNYNNLGRGISGTNGGYMSGFTYDEHGMIPKTVSGSDSTFVPDGCWLANGSMFFFWGSPCAYGLKVGVAFNVSTPFSHSSWAVSPTPAYKYPKAA